MLVLLVLLTLFSQVGSEAFAKTPKKPTLLLKEAERLQQLGRGTGSQTLVDSGKARQFFRHA